MFRDLKPLQNNYLRVISGASKATFIRNMEEEVGVRPLETYLDRIQAQFRVRLEESETAGVIRDTKQMVEI